MTGERVVRRLAAILAADVAGYSRLMGRDEHGTLTRLKAHRAERLEPALARHGGRLVKLTGDGALVEFPSAVDALGAAVGFQQAMAEANVGQSEDTRIVFRIGLHLGDLIVDGDDLYGDGVNVAARLEAEAPAGGIVISGDVHNAVTGRLKVSFDDLGMLSLKNIERPVQAFGVKWHAADWKASTSAIAALPLPAIPTADATLTPPDKPSIAVLPFQNMSGDPEQEFFADGMVEDIITQLSRSRDFLVIARNSSFSYKGASPDIRQVGRELGVRYVLEGSVRKAGNRLRITAQLIDATTGSHLWAERYDCEATDIFAVQDEITGNVVASLEPQLLLAEGGLAKRQTPTDLNAWGCVTRAYAHIAVGSREALQAAFDLLERAIEGDPRYARAHANLATTLMIMAYRGWIDDRDQAIEAATASASRAIELDANDPWAHYAKGLVATMTRHYGEGLPSLKRAVELNPNFALAHSRLGNILAYLGQAEAGIEHTARALRISPRDPLRSALLNAHGIALFAAGRYAEAAAVQERASQERAGFAQALRTLIASRALQGDVAGAKIALKDLHLAQPEITLTWVDRNVDAPETIRRVLIDGLRLAGMPE